MSDARAPIRFPWQWVQLYRHLRSDPLGAFTRVARQHGDVAYGRLGRRSVVLLSHPRDVQEVLVLQQRLYQKGPGAVFTGRALGQGLLTSEDLMWRQARRRAQPAFHRQAVRELSSAIVGVTERHTALWRDGDERDIAEDMAHLAFRIATEILFGTNGDAATDVVRSEMAVAMRYANGRISTVWNAPLWVPTPGSRRFHEAVRRLNDVVGGIVVERERSPGVHRDLLDLLLAGRGATPERGLRQVREDMLTFLLAGHETTATTLAWVWHLLDQNPWARDLLEQELAAKLQGVDPTPDDLAGLPWTRAVITETLRLYPPVWVMARETRVPVVLGGREFPARTLVLMSQWVVHRDPRWFEAPDQFRPQRWLDGTTDDLPTFAYFPFGGGPRLCIGKPLALTELALVVAWMAQRFRLHERAGASVLPQPLITLKPGGSVPVRVEVRSSPGAVKAG